MNKWLENKIGPMWPTTWLAPIGLVIIIIAIVVMISACNSGAQAGDGGDSANIYRACINSHVQDVVGHNIGYGRTDFYVVICKDGTTHRVDSE